MKAYAIKDPKGIIKLVNCKDSEKECKDAWFSENPIHWSNYEKLGFTCVPVEII